MSSSPVWEVEVSWRPERDGPQPQVPSEVPGLRAADPRAVELASRIEEWLGRELGAEGGDAAAPISVRRLFYLQSLESAGSELEEAHVERIARRLLSDSVTETFTVRSIEAGTPLPAVQFRAGQHIATVRKKTGVMEPVEESLLSGLDDLAHEAGSNLPTGAGQVRVRLASRVCIASPLTATERQLLADKVLSNQAIEDVFWDDEPVTSPFAAAVACKFERCEIDLAGLSDDELLEKSRQGQLSLNLSEMRCIRDFFAGEGRSPTDVELETLAQTWSEHCCHKTLTASIEHRTTDAAGGNLEVLRFENLLKDTIARATTELIEGDKGDFCLSVFKDNAGVVAFDDEYGVSFKVETHNHPSAIEPYGGAGTGIGGVLRDTLGTGLGAKPILNTDVFCFGPPDLPHDEVPTGALHPMRALRGVVGGVRDYGNRMGIPTGSGALFFDERYIGNPLVFCGSVGLLPRSMVEKEVRAGDRVVVLGGRTGRDGIHGATFSSIELSQDSETVSSGAVQIGNAITEKKVLDVLLIARDRGLYRGLTDCGAGGLSSAVGEMGEEVGARVDLDRVPLKYEGLTYWEVWISEAQERMVFAVPPENLEALRDIAASHDVDLTDIGEFSGTGRLELFWKGQSVADLDMRFLHDGRPSATRESRFVRPRRETVRVDSERSAGEILRDILAHPNVASKEWVIRQYDHEVQGRSILKPLQGVREDGPGDGVVYVPRLGSLRGVAVACGMNPRYGDLDPYRMAVSAIDESVRNVVAAGGDPDRCAILDNFCWGNTDNPETLGSLVEASRGCYDAAVQLGTPFVSGKDSLYNEFRTEDGTLAIPPSLLISSIAIVEDVRSCVSMDLKAAGNLLWLVGATEAEIGASHLARVLGVEGGVVPGLPENARDLHRAVCAAIASGLVESAHDLSEGGLGVAAAEMAFSGEVGAELRLADLPAAAESAGDLELLFSESNARYLLEVRPESVVELARHFEGLPGGVVGETLSYCILRVLARDGSTLCAEALDDLKRAWKEPLAFDGVV